jgi:hypothetical protein
MEALMLSSTADRVPQHTDAEINEQIRQTTAANVACYATAGPAAISRRLSELDEEWDIERAVEANAATVSLIGLALGATSDRRWFLLPAAVAGFLLQHALQGWCPPIPVLRRLGFRTATEIEEERQALKVIRGDYVNVGRNSDVGETLQAVRL